MRAFFVLAACLMLQACLTTTKPAFDELNSVAAGDAPALVAFVEAWEAKMGAEDSPRELITNKNRVHEIDGLVIVQEVRGEMADYYAVGLMGSRPVLCLVHDEKLDEIAARHGVTLEVKREEGNDDTMPAAMTADGTKEQLFKFVIDAYTDGMLTCQVPSPVIGQF